MNNRPPTYLAMQTGSWQDLSYLKRAVGCQITFDNEHFNEAIEFLVYRDGGKLPSFKPDFSCQDVTRLHDMAGYWLIKGYPPETQDVMGIAKLYNSYLNSAHPRLFHLGGGLYSIDEQNRAATHLPISRDNKDQIDRLQMVLEWILKNQSNVVGAVIEVVGFNDGASDWSARIFDDEVAKMQTYLTVINEIEKLQKAS